MQPLVDRRDVELRFSPSPKARRCVSEVGIRVAGTVVEILAEPGGSALPDHAAPYMPSANTLRFSPSPEARRCLHFSGSAQKVTQSLRFSPSPEARRCRHRPQHHLPNPGVEILAEPGGSALRGGYRQNDCGDGVEILAEPGGSALPAANTSAASRSHWLRFSPSPEARRCQIAVRLAPAVMVVEILAEPGGSALRTLRAGHRWALSVEILAEPGGSALHWPPNGMPHTRRS